MPACRIHKHTDACQSLASLLGGMTDSATHHSMDQELKQFALGGFPGSPRRVLRSHLLAPLRSLLLLSSPLPSPSLRFPSPAPLSKSLCSPFQHCPPVLLFSPALSLSSLASPCARSPAAESLCTVSSTRSLLEFRLPFRSPARRGGEGGWVGRGSGRGVSASPPCRPPLLLLLLSSCLLCSSLNATQLLHSIGR